MKTSGQLGVTDLSQIRSLAGLDVGLKLLDHVRGLTIELGGLDLNIRMLLIPLGNDVVDQSHALGIRQTVHVGDVDHATIIGGLRVAGSVAAATRPSPFPLLLPRQKQPRCAYCEIPYLYSFVVKSSSQCDD